MHTDMAVNKCLFLLPCYSQLNPAAPVQQCNLRGVSKQMTPMQISPFIYTFARKDNVTLISCQTPTQKHHIYLFNYNTDNWRSSCTLCMLTFCSTIWWMHVNITFIFHILFKNTSWWSLTVNISALPPERCIFVKFVYDLELCTDDLQSVISVMRTW